MEISELIKIHYLKCEAQYFDAVEDRSKTAELRLNDRHYTVGDYIMLIRYFKVTKRFDDHYLLLKVTHIVDDPRFLLPNYCMISFEFVDRGRINQDLLERFNKEMAHEDRS